MYKQILLAYDGSQAGQKALLDCQDIVQWSGAALTLVAVMPREIIFGVAEGGFYDPENHAREKRNYKSVLEQGLRTLTDSGFKVSGEVLLGDSVHEISSYARKISADLIVVGYKHEKNWVARWWGGSGSSALVEHAPCSVLMVIT
jgi:nucleotide-binding universal stress UspA family protein